MLTVLGVALALGCGGDDPPRKQTVFWMQLSEGTGAQSCSSAQSYSVPDSSARNNIIGGGGGERLEDGGDDIVECRVSEAAAPGQFDISLRISSGVIGSFLATGVVAPGQPGTGTVDVDFTTADFSLEQDDCTATVQQVIEGAMWITNVSCSDMRDPSSPAIACVGTGGWIAENCTR